MTMKFDYRKYLNVKRLIPIWEYIQRYKYVLTSLVVFLIFYFVIARINSFTNIELDQEKYDQGIVELKRITFDEEAIEKIKALQNRDVTVDTDLPSNRDNPF